MELSTEYMYYEFFVRFEKLFSFINTDNKHEYSHYVWTDISY